MTLLRSQRVQRYTLGAKPTEGESLRDVQQGLDATPLQFLRTVDGIYTEPMSVGAMLANPSAIEAIRVTDLTGNQETPVACGSLCHFAWKPQLGGAQITSIDGMSTTIHGGKKFRFTFRITYSG